MQPELAGWLGDLATDFEAEVVSRSSKTVPPAAAAAAARALAVLLHAFVRVAGRTAGFSSGHSLPCSFAIRC